MKKKIFFTFLALLMSFSFMTCAHAEEESRWQAVQPERKVTSDGLIVDYDLSDLDITRWWMEGTVKITVTIPEDYHQDSIVIAPEVFEEIIRAVELNDNDNVQFGNAFQAGDSLGVDITINNLSKYTYNYDDTSFEIFPKEDIVYYQVSEDEEDHSATLFNDLNTNDHHHFSRVYNTALRALIPGVRNLDLTDEAIDAALKNAGYSGIDDYTNYLLDFYNNKYGTDYTRLDSFPDGIIREILSECDPFLNTNSAYRALGVSRITYDNVLAAVQRKGYSSIEEYIVDYYNQKYGTNATKIVELSAEALDEFFSSQGNQQSGGYYINETNSDVNALAYGFLYNKGMAFGFEDDVINNDNSEEYSVGEYMRDLSKGDEGIKKGAATLLPNGVGTIKNAKFKSSGNYILNSFINYEFMADMQFTYSALKGTVRAIYVDVNGNVLCEDVVTSGMVNDDYETFAKTFDGYTLIKIDGDEKGVYIDGEIVVVYVYEPKTETTEVPTVKEVNSEIVPPKTGIQNASLGILYSLIIMGFALALLNRMSLEKNSI